jgi:DNA (cytosine-5)-methyltransferase 1
VNPTLNSFDVGDTRATTANVEPVLVENSYRDGARIAHDGVSQTLTSKMGTGGGNTPMLAFDTQFGSNANVTEDVAPTLKASQQSPSVAYPIDTRNALRDPEKYDAQNRQGLGIGADGDPMATLTSAHVNAVAFSHYDSQVTVGEVSPTLRSGTNGTGHAVAYDEYNDTTNEVHHALRAGTKQSTGVLEPTMAVRRLTPLECERLMGWPDNHTLTKADGTTQADTHRYKQCGNGVASPVAQWIAKHLLNI